jgi:hypothetical protein
MRKIHTVPTQEEAEQATALSRWETEGGKDPSGWDQRRRFADVAYVHGLPVLPPGHTSQVAWSFRDPAGGLFYDFFRVYRPPRPRHGLGPICQLDEKLSYWLTIFWPSGQSTSERPVCRFIHYWQARQLTGPRLSFARFSSPLPMVEDTRRLLAATPTLDPPPEARPLPLVGRLAN